MSLAPWPTEGPSTGAGAPPGPPGPGEAHSGPGAVTGGAGPGWSWPSTDAAVPARGQVASAGALMVAALALHVAAMFPAYPGQPPSPVAALPHYLAMFVCLEAGWALAAGLVLVGGRLRQGVALGAGLGLVEAGLLVANVLGGFDEGTAGAAGAWLSLAGLAAGLAGVLWGASLVPMGRPVPGRARGLEVAMVLAGLLAVAEFWPSWQSGQLVFRAADGSLLSAPVNGFTFDQPLGVALPSTLAGLAIGVIVVVAAFWVPRQVGAWAVVGVAVALGSQLLEAVVGALEPVQDYLNGGSTSGIDVARSSVSLNAVWGAETASVLALLVLAGAVIVRGHRRPPGPALTPGLLPGVPGEDGAGEDGAGEDGADEGGAGKDGPGATVPTPPQAGTGRATGTSGPAWPGSGS